MMYEDTMTSAAFIDFWGRLLPEDCRKVYIIVDNSRIHHSKKVKEWLKRHEIQIRVAFLPSYSPELNPDECLNNHLKNEMRKRGHARSQEELKSRAKRFMKKLVHRANVVRNYFEHPVIAYGT